jgi:peroxiredoxin
VVIFLAFLGNFAYSASFRPNLLIDIETGSSSRKVWRAVPAPDFTLKAIAGEEITLSRLRGRDFILLAFGPHDRSVFDDEALMNLMFLSRHQWRKKGGWRLKIIVVDNNGDTSADILAKAAEKKLPRNFIFTKGNPVLNKAYSVNGDSSVTTVFLIDLDGDIQARFDGLSSRKAARSLEQKVANLRNYLVQR